jgi:hypothetical protein
MPSRSQSRNQRRVNSDDQEVSQCHRCNGPIIKSKTGIFIKDGNHGFGWTAPTGDVVLEYCQSCFIDMARWVAKQSKESQ